MPNLMILIIILEWYVIGKEIAKLISTSLVSWVLDTRYGSHICINMQKLNKSRSLQNGEVDLHVEDEQKLLHCL